MKRILRVFFVLFLILNAVVVISQNKRIYRPLNAELTGVKNGRIMKKSTSDFDISIFEDGRLHFEINLNNINIFTDTTGDEHKFADDILVVEGVCPVAEMFNNQQPTQAYKIDLNVVNNGISETMIFDVNIMYNKLNKVRTVLSSTNIDMSKYNNIDLGGMEPNVTLTFSYEVKRQQ